MWSLWLMQCWLLRIKPTNMIYSRKGKAFRGVHFIAARERDNENIEIFCNLIWCDELLLLLDGTQMFHEMWDGLFAPPCRHLLKVLKFVHFISGKRSPSDECVGNKSNLWTLSQQHLTSMLRNSLNAWLCLYGLSLWRLLPFFFYTFIDCKISHLKASQDLIIRRFYRRLHVVEWKWWTSKLYYIFAL